MNKTLLDAIKQRDIESFEKLFPETTNYDGCLKEMSSNYGFHPKHHQMLIDVTTDFEGCYLGAIKINKMYLLEDFHHKTTDYTGCLNAAICMQKRTPEIILKLIEKTPDIDQSFLMYLKKNNQTIDCVKAFLAKANDTTGCFYAATSNYSTSDDEVEIIEFLMESDKIKDEEKFLHEDFWRMDFHESIVMKLLENTKDTTKLLPKVIKDYPKHVVSLLIKKTTEVNDAIRRGFEDVGTVVKLITHAFKNKIKIDYGKCLSYMVKNDDMPLELLEGFLKRCDNSNQTLYNIINSDVVYPEYFLDDLFDKTTIFDGLDQALRAGHFSKQFILKLISKNDDFSSNVLCNALKGGYTDKEILDILTSKTTDFEECLNIALRSGSYDMDFLLYLYSKTKDFCNCLTSALVEGVYDMDFLLLLHSKTKNFAWCYIAALIHPHLMESEQYSALVERFPKPHTKEELKGILKLGSHIPTSILDEIVARTGRVDCKNKLPEHGKYTTFVYNTECFVCLMDFETPVNHTGENAQKTIPEDHTECHTECHEEDSDEEDPEKAVPMACGHMIHSGCNHTPFKCPYH